MMNLEKFLAISELYLEMTAQSSKELSSEKLKSLLDGIDDLEMALKILVMSVTRKAA